MAQVSSIAMALASQSSSRAIPKTRPAGDHSGTASYERAASALLTPPNSISPELAAWPNHASAMSPPLMDITEEMDLEDRHDSPNDDIQQGGMPLSKGALSNLDDAVTITPSMLAKHHLPGIMLGNGPRPIRYVMGELCQTVPGFSRIPPAKARRIVVAALESRSGGGLDGNVEFCKTGWGRWDAHIKGSSRDSAVGSFNDGHLSPPRSERSYAVSHTDSGVNMPAVHMHGKHREHYYGGSWTEHGLREEDELDMDDMDPLEEAADKMSLDGESDSDSLDDETDDEDWAAVGVDALREASLPTSNAPQLPVRAVSIPYNGRFAQKSWQRRPSNNNFNSHSSQSTSLPYGSGFNTITPAMQTPEEHEAIAALIKMGSM
ncbi:hypothetical protein CLAFUW4_01659 [Fulvia fulva]|uniref:Sin3 binding protein-domain-containing protein n=1 Tax=Passalora fulva TaxID=5499 RepID=A0A9Q8L8H3_PASFU|nr:uncharacterized protein CLAFUR5_01658 [Fulvia fulva]KAK4634297.1 hypothetical protein CLAFUR4_01657 [Fulvia fulva]KAK4638476.1 hypothetical protein CLAFUR0_01658 [Fulvia fulva]UJO12732.1 hypothetical protein CLAFUR5_01658 [Fulvia fulva]WPV09194.1 hypothetical protein CLAFUW4_01659 [Fulvia fulva]WPV23993.1 hypothetical protein CLAFUW7_01661 [Fulvia fulva]